VGGVLLVPEQDIIGDDDMFVTGRSVGRSTPRRRRTRVSAINWLRLRSSPAARKESAC
jgi:hypothetical protein